MLYRNSIRNCNLIYYEIRIKESNLLIYSKKRLYRQAKSSLLKFRKEIEGYIKLYPEFAETFTPMKLDKQAPLIIKSMLKAAQIADVGPMASVAGAIAEALGRDLLEFSSEIIVENGGDIFLKSSKERTIAIFAGKSPLSKKIAIISPKSRKPFCLCTSSGTVGHSFSYGVSDAVAILSKNCAYSDVWATRVGNMIRKESDIRKAINLIGKEPTILGGLIIKGKKIAVAGKIKLKNI